MITREPAQKEQTIKDLEAKNRKYKKLLLEIWRDGTDQNKRRELKALISESDFETGGLAMNEEY